MVIRITHKKISEVEDSPDPTKVNASDWNETHLVEGLVPEAPDDAGYLRKAGAWVAPQKADVGLGNADNTRDVDKPVSTAAAAALASKEPSIASGTSAQYLRGDKTWQTLDRAAVGLGNVDNSADTNKPVSGPQQQALDTKANDTAVVKLTGDQDIQGQKSFKGRLVVASAANSALRLDSTVTEGGIPQSFSVNVTDSSAVNRISAQSIRFVYNRQGTAQVSAFDSLFVTTPQIFSDAPYQLRGFTFEGPVMSAGKTLAGYTALKIQAPSGSGTVGAKVAIEVDYGAGPVLIGAAAGRGDLLRVAGSSTLSGPVSLGQYTLNTLPSAAAFADAYITVTNAAGGSKLCRSDATNWLIVNTSTAVS
ncbi:hypothetical protein [Xylophilus ampelinus]|uniref:Uncharacterized protein n=1 Tax=Xylophilus ampelinus TaxID=54067 RepID=A0A318SL07_9BURK|nr:hypothetical protein [Xylophilus ampelinus]MCS4509128.1 hypothetical protein [Xylophilus ampelinus]PYE79844.1 hypothetical protein DFQ15_101164 [Xylophilus ampelinus]